MTSCQVISTDKNKKSFIGSVHNWVCFNLHRSPEEHSLRAKVHARCLFSSMSTYRYPDCRHHNQLKPSWWFRYKPVYSETFVTAHKARHQQPFLLLTPWFITFLSFHQDALGSTCSARSFFEQSEAPWSNMWGNILGGQRSAFNKEFSERVYLLAPERERERHTQQDVFIQKNKWFKQSCKCVFICTSKNSELLQICLIITFY